MIRGALSFSFRFEKCAMERIRENADKYADNLLPTLIDVAGVENENSELWKELLKIVFFGRLPKGEALYSAYKYGVKDGVEVCSFQGFKSLNNIYSF